MTGTHELAVGALVAVTMIGCGTSNDGATAAATTSGQTPQGCGLPAPPADFSYPAGPYGTEVGDRFADFTLERCDGTKLKFSTVLANSELVWFNVGAGWCQPCIEETPALEESFAKECGRGLRVVQVLFEDARADPATKLFCEQWQSEFDLTFPVLVDPLFITSEYFESVSTPLNMLIDSSGTIVFRETGTIPTDIDQRIDALLPAQP
jgi:peroxiredoxin